MNDDNDDNATLETVKDAGTTPAGTVKRWLLELSLADKEEKDWRKTADRVEKRYRGDSKPGQEAARRNQFNILWSNTETLSPSLYNSTPTPDVRRRFRDKDPIGKAAAELLERSLDYALDAYDFDDVMQDAIHDTLIVGRAVARIRYMPSFKTVDATEMDGSDEDGSYEALEYEQVICELVPWADFRHGPGKRWRDVSWIAFQSFLTREELVEKFGAIGKTIELEDVDMGDEHKDADDQERDVFKRLSVWEIWDKDKREVVFLAASYKDKPLKVEPDPMGLDGFFPIPRPMYSIRSTKNLVPIPEYTLYEDQANELDRISARIVKLIAAIKFRGIYDSTIGELQHLMNDDETVFRPAQNVTALIERGGLEKAIWTMPIEMAANVLAALYQSRDQTKQTIYEITGISDILRGSTDPNETATAQGIKNQWGALRLQRRQAEVQRFARDVLRLKAEIIAEKFQPETVLDMANLKFPTQAEKQQAQQQQMMAMQQQQPMMPPSIPQPGMPLPPPQPPPSPPDPAMIEMLDKPSVEEVFSFLRDNAHRQFRIDIESDSTIAAILQQDQKNITELLSGMTAFMQGVAPAVQTGALPMGAAKAIMLAAVRRYKLGSEVEDELDKIPEQLPPQPGKDDGEAGKAALQAERAGMQAEMKGKETEFQAKEGEIKLKELGMKIQEKAMALDVREQQMGIREQELGLRDQVSGVREGQIDQRETGVSETEAGVTEMQESATAQVQEIVAQAQQDMAMQMQEFMVQISTMQANDSAKTHADMMLAITSMVGAMTAPKRIIRDQAGRAAGVETVQ